MVNSVFFAHAQETTPFKIDIIPQADHVAAGELLTYTVTITNISQTTLPNGAVEIEVPQGTKFLNTRYSSLKWYGGNPVADPDFKLKKIKILTIETIEPGETFTFEMIVRVLAETTQEIVIENYRALDLIEQVSATGPPIKTQVTPVPTLTPLPTSTPSRTPTFIATTTITPPPPTTPVPPRPTAAPGVGAGAGSTPVAVVSASSPESLQKTDENFDRKPNTTTPNTSSFFWITIPVILSLLILAVWFFRRR